MSTALIDWDELPAVLTVPEAAKAARVGKAAIYNYARTRGQGFPVVRFGKAIRIPRDAFRAWLESQQV